MNVMSETKVNETTFGFVSSCTFIGEANVDVLCQYSEHALDGVKEHERIATGSGYIIAPKVTVRSLSTLGKEFHRIAVIAHTLPFGGPIDGLLGMDILCRLKAKITTVSGMIEVERNHKNIEQIFASFLRLRRYSRSADYRSVSGLQISVPFKTIGTFGTAGTIGTGFF
jgi:hypothetical protein